jgi:DNA polymerase-4
MVLTRTAAMSDASLPILHVDMDAFYASVEQRDNPEMRGLPVIVGGLGGRGVVCAASYEARSFGVHSAMPMATVRRLCPRGIYLPVRMQHYKNVSQQLREILLSFTPLVEPLSLDEAFLDVHGCERLFGSAPEIAHQIRARIKAELGLTASVGVASNKFLAKLASDHGKPDGCVVVPPDRVSEFLAPLPVGRIWGVGAKAEKRLHALGITTIGQLAQLPEQVLLEHFGDMGQHVWQVAHGWDDRRVVADREAQSISTEKTFGHDIDDPETLRAWLRDLTDQLSSRLRAAGIRARSIEVKMRTSDFQTRHAAQALPEATDLTEILWETVWQIFDRMLTQALLPVRLLGVGATRLTHDTAVQGDLFDDGLRKQRQALDQTVDAIREQFGTAGIRRANRLDQKESSGM